MRRGSVVGSLARDGGDVTLGGEHLRPEAEGEEQRGARSDSTGRPATPGTRLSATAKRSGPLSPE